MQVGLLSDIHANLPALEAVLDDLPGHLDALVCAGDIVGYSAWPTECLQVIRERCDVIVQGNHDREVDTTNPYPNNDMAQAGLKYAASELSAAQIDWLEELPPEATAFDNRLHVVHSHPENTDRYVPKGMFPEVSTYMDESTDILALGHTHQQAAVNMARFDRHGWVVNPGSVGQPRDGNPKAAYAIADLSQPMVELHRVAYPIDEVREAHTAAELPTASADRLSEGH